MQRTTETLQLRRDLCGSTGLGALQQQLSRHLRHPTRLRRLHWHPSEELRAYRHQWQAVLWLDEQLQAVRQFKTTGLWLATHVPCGRILLLLLGPDVNNTSRLRQEVALRHIENRGRRQCAHGSKVLPRKLQPASQ